MVEAIAFSIYQGMNLNARVFLPRNKLDFGTYQRLWLNG